MIARGRTGEAVELAGGGRVWVGKAGDPFWIEPDVLHAVGHAFQDGTTIDLSSWYRAEAKNLFNEDLGDRLNENVPADDVRLHGEPLIDTVAGVVRAYGIAEDPEAYARTVVSKILPNVLPYTVGTPAAYGFAEWNGRSLTDNAPDVMFSFAANTPVTLAIGKESVTAKPSRTFPYVPAAS